MPSKGRHSAIYVQATPDLVMCVALPSQWKRLVPIVQRLFDIAGPRAAEVFAEFDRAGP